MPEISPFSPESNDFPKKRKWSFSCVQSWRSESLVGGSSKQSGLLGGNGSLALSVCELLGTEALGLDVLLGLGGADGVLADGSKCLLVVALDVSGLDSVLDVLGELGVVSLLVRLLERLHVVGNVETVDVLAVNGGIELLGLGVVAREAAVAVGDVKTTIDGTLEGSEDTGTSRGALETDVEEGAEWASGALLGLNVVLGTVGGGLASVRVSEAELGERLAGWNVSHCTRKVREQHTRRARRRPVA